MTSRLPAEAIAVLTKTERQVVGALTGEFERSYVIGWLVWPYHTRSSVANLTKVHACHIRKKLEAFGVTIGHQRGRNGGLRLEHMEA